MLIYEQISQDILNETADHWLFQKVVDHIVELLGDKWFPYSNVEQLQGTPVAGKNVYYLWAFQCELMAGGMAAWVTQRGPRAPEIIASHAALKAVGAVELVELLEASFSAARPLNPAFLRQPEVAWFDQFRANPRWPSFDEIELPAAALGEEKLSALAAKYIREHRGDL